MWNQEKVELTIDNFWLFNKALINISTLGWIVNESLSVLICRLLEKSLSDSLVHDDQGNFWRVISTLSTIEKAVLFLNDLVKLFKLKIDNLLTHWVSNSITVDKNVIWHFTGIKITIALEWSHKIIRQYCWGNDFLTFLRLWRCLSIVFTHVSIIGCTKADSTLFTFMANINSY